MYHWEKLNLNYRIIWCLVYLAGKKDFLFFIYPILCFRPSTPIEEVLRHSYGDKWLESIQNKEANIKKDKPDATVKKKKHEPYLLILYFELDSF